MNFIKIEQRFASRSKQIVCTHYPFVFIGPDRYVESRPGYHAWLDGSIVTGGRA